MVSQLIVGSNVACPRIEALGGWLPLQGVHLEAVKRRAYSFAWGLTDGRRWPMAVTWGHQQGTYDSSGTGACSPLVVDLAKENPTVSEGFVS